ncbi:MAG: uracil-DNA glycosylase [Cytophagales bacterium]|nr:uracil-DNA glycosylase [Cytophagales bacterium]
MDVKIAADWKKLLEGEFGKDYFKSLTAFVRSEYSSSVIYPPGKEIFAAFDACPFEKLKVVILGQDPYHGPGQANGLCFSVKDGVRMPPSLVNIFKELKEDLGIPIPSSGNLTRWAEQGVLLLNATLTVRAEQAGSHQNKGWEIFTDAVVRIINLQKEKVVFVLWGAYAQKKGGIIDVNRHFVIKSAHPSPLSAHNGFFGSKPFSQTNAYLTAQGLSTIEW